MMQAVTGLGILCSLGSNRREVLQNLLAGRDGIGTIGRFSTGMFSAHNAAMLQQSLWDDLGMQFPDVDRRTAMAITAAKEALADAGVDTSRDKLAFVYGICVGGRHGDDEAPAHTLLRNRLQNQAAAIASVLSLTGPCLVVSTACASAAHALGISRNLLRFGFATAVLVGGAGDVTPEMFAGFHALGVMSPGPCAPYSAPVGLNLGEGAAFFVIENIRSPGESGKRPIAYLAGYGSSLDAYHPTTPDPAGSGVARALSGSMADAGLSAAHIDYVNTHGTGTAENDKAEWQGIKAALGARAMQIPLSSSKSFLGHTGGASGIVEAAVTVLSMHHQVVPPTMHAGRLRKLAPPDIVNSSAPRPHTCAIAASCSSAFGGANAAVILAHHGHPPAPRPVRFAPVEIAGTGFILPGGKECASIADCVDVHAIDDREAFSSEPRRITGIDLSKYTKGRDERYLDPVTRYLAAASSLAMEQGGYQVDDVRAPKRGLFTGAAHIPSASLTEFENSRKERGLTGISAHAFSRIVMNAATGAVAEILRLKGPTATIASGEGAGLMALVLACMELSADPSLEFVIAASADELGPIPLKIHRISARTCAPAEAGAAIVLAPSGTASLSGRVCVTGIGMAGPREPGTAISQALAASPGAIDYCISANDGSAGMIRLESAGMETIRHEAGAAKSIRLAGTTGYSEATTALMCVVLASYLLKKNNSPRVKRVLIISVSGINGSCSVLVERME